MWRAKEDGLVARIDTALGMHLRMHAYSRMHGMCSRVLRMMICGIACVRVLATPATLLLELKEIARGQSCSSSCHSALDYAPIYQIDPWSASWY